KARRNGALGAANAGVMASRKGSATAVAPRPRRNVRRGTALPVMIPICSLPPRGGPFWPAVRSPTDSDATPDLRPKIVAETAPRCRSQPSGEGDVDRRSRVVRMLGRVWGAQGAGSHRACSVVLDAFPDDRTSGVRPLARGPAEGIRHD